MMVNVSKIARTEYSMVRSIARAPILLPCALIFVRLMVLPFLESKVGTSAIVVTMRQQKILCLMANAQHRVMGMHLKFVVVVGNSISSLSHLKLFLKSSTKSFFFTCFIIASKNKRIGCLKIKVDMKNKNSRVAFWHFFPKMCFSLIASGMTVV